MKEGCKKVLLSVIAVVVTLLISSLGVQAATVKTNMFNGIHHPSIAIRRMTGEIEVLREYRYEDYRDRMD